MVYDTDRNITWVADGNLFKTLANNYTGGAEAYVQSIISANNGTILTTPTIFDGNDGVYDLSSNDFDIVTGKMTWYGAHAWTNALSYGGFGDWRLPLNKGLKEMQSLYLALGGIELDHSNPPGVQTDFGIFNNGQAGYDSIGSITMNNIIFSNVHSSNYWADSDGSPYNPGYGDGYWFYIGGFSGSIKNTANSYAWAVRDGDVAAVPVPGAAWLMGSGLLGLLGFKRRHRAA